MRFEGRHFAQALYGLLETNQTVDQSTSESARNANGGYDTFGAYVAGEVKCPECHSPMQLKKGKTGIFSGVYRLPQMQPRGIRRGRHARLVFLFQESERQAMSSRQHLARSVSGEVWHVCPLQRNRKARVSA